MNWNNPPIKKIKSVSLKPLTAPFSESLAVPGSKSVTNRAFLLAGAAQGVSTLSNFLEADDSHWCCDVLTRLGVTLEWTHKSVRVHGTNNDWPQKKASLYLGDAGTLARFLPGILAMANKGEWEITASEQLAKRPITPVLSALQNWGCDITVPASNYPFVIRGCQNSGGKTNITGRTSSQFISGLLLASPLANKKTEIRVEGDLIQKDYVEMTLQMMRDFGVTVEAAPDYSSFSTEPQRYRARDYSIEADASTASYFFALAAATKGRVTITNLKRDCLQPDIGFLSILERMGCKVIENQGGITLQAPPQLKGNLVLDMEKVSDTVPTLAAIAPYADGPITVTGVAHIRHHESDRLHALYTVLTKSGVACEEKEDGLVIRPSAPHFATLPSFGDHRIAMSMSVMGLAGAGVEIENPGCVAKTCPVFFDILEKMNVPVGYTS